MRIDPDVAHMEAVFKIGRVISVNGRRVSIAVDKSKNGSHFLFRGDLLRNVSVGGYVKIAKGFGEIIAQVDGERVGEEKVSNSIYRQNSDNLKRILEVSLIGFFTDGVFERGVREMPLLDNECFLLTETEFGRISNFVAKNDLPLILGSLAMEPNQSVAVGINALFASHVGIFGNTGSGKSYTLAKIYHELFKAFAENENFRKNAKFVLIDFNGEYVNSTDSADAHTSSKVIIGDELKQTYILSTRDDSGHKIPLRSSVLHDPTFWTVLLNASEKTQAPFLNRVLNSNYWDGKLNRPDELKEIIGDLVLTGSKSGDTSTDRSVIVNFLHDIQTCLGNAAPDELQTLIESFRQNLQYNGSLRNFYWTRTGQPDIYSSYLEWPDYIKAPVVALPLDFAGLTNIDLIRFKIVIQYYSDIIRGYANREHIGPLIKRLETKIPHLKRLIKIDDTKLLLKPLTVISFRNVNLEMRKIIPMILCKQLYEDKKALNSESAQYLNLIIDEAHNILSSDSARESEEWRDYRLETFEEIVKEGRKFGVFLTIASQRPHDISETIISQLHNFFLHRLINNLDIHAMEKAVSYLDRVSFESLPILPTGTCVLSGVSAQVPVIVKIGKIPAEFEPDNKTMTVTSDWNRT